jgi:aryl-alcohol dehydrogenase-like predicted oxidoreductase
MEKRQLGRSGIAVTRIALGCGNFGGIGSAPELFGQGTQPDEAFRIMDAAWDLGLTTFDTADAYGGGRSEQTIGAWLRTKPSSVRSAVTIVSKTFNPMAPGDDRGLSQRRILRQLDISLRRLGVECVAAYMAHAFDAEVPQEETLRAFDELVRAGKIGCTGASNFSAEQLAESLELAELEGVTRYEVVQNEYHLLAQGDRETVFPVCREHAVAYQAFGPLAGGWLTGKYRRGADAPPGSRMTLRPGPYERFRDDRVYAAVDAFGAAAAERGASPAALAIAWLLADEEVASIVIGPMNASHLDAVAEALQLRLDAGERDELAGVFA